MKNFTFTVGSSGTSVAGILTWDPSTGALSTLKVTDGWNSAASETCNYGYNDMAQVTSVACGSLWSQTFSTDAYGNLSKSGSLTFSPGYDPTTNRYTSLLNAKYDNNGNLTNDGTNGYSFDSNNLVATVVTASGTNGITRDAFGRMAEIASPTGTYAEILYSALGRTAKMSGNNVQNIFAPLTGGAKLEVKGTTYLFHHKDWLGTSRFISSRGSRNLFFDAAYAPFGESYSTSGTTDLNFTGQRQDIVAGLYDFQYREYIPNHGRWLSPDLAGLRAVDPTNPQTWNRYAYVTNNPLSAVDPMGLQEQEGNADEEEIQSDSMDPPDIGSILADSGANDSGAATMNDILNSPNNQDFITPNGWDINTTPLDANGAMAITEGNFGTLANNTSDAGANKGAAMAPDVAAVGFFQSPQGIANQDAVKNFMKGLRRDPVKYEDPRPTNPSPLDWEKDFMSEDTAQLKEILDLTAEWAAGALEAIMPLVISPCQYDPMCGIQHGPNP
jgi:RHS repeat-associated protein